MAVFTTLRFTIFTIECGLAITSLTQMVLRWEKTGFLLLLVFGEEMEEREMRFEFGVNVLDGLDWR